MANPITIRKGLKLGELDAEADTDLLTSCFVDKGELSRLQNVDDPLAIIVGRTGSGKSALLYRIKSTAEHAVALDLNDISVQFLEHSNIIHFLNALGINLDLFYRVLWRHVLTVELLKLRYPLRTQAENSTFIARLSQRLRVNPIEERAFAYFREWGDKFWLQTDEQLREITTRLTRDVTAQLGVAYQGISLSADGAKSLTEEQRAEVSSRARQAVSAIQIQRLNEVLELLANHAFEDRQKKYFVLIDRLDENWAETVTRVRFIRALIEEIKAFRRLRQVKILAALRNDLLDLVFDRTRDAGFQEEKYDAYLLHLKWSRDDLKNLIDLRVGEVFRRQYTASGIRFEDLFPLKPRKKGGQLAIDFIIDRTLYRPRDILQFLNECISVSFDAKSVSWRAINAAEATYSSKRLKSLREEWSEFYPAFGDTVEILRGLTSPFTRSDLSGQRFEDVATNLAGFQEHQKADPCVELARKFLSPRATVTEAELLSQILRALYHVGAIGIKISALDPFAWSFTDQMQVSKSDVKRANQIKIHKMLHRALEIQLILEPPETLAQT